jgi:hypothetical protein
MRNIAGRTFALAAALSLCSPAARADEAPSPMPPPHPDAEVEVETTDRRVRRIEARNVPGAVDLEVGWRGTGDAFLQPGLYGRLTLPLRQRDLWVDGGRTRRGFRHRTRTFELGAELGTSTRINAHTLVHLLGTAGTRVTRTSGYHTGPSVGLGVNRMILAHPSWAVNRNGVARRRYLQGPWSGVATLSYTVGFDLARRRETRIRKGKTARPPMPGPVILSLRPTWMILAPLGRTWADLLSLDLGVRVALGRRESP